MYRLGIDVGGTNTDAIIMDEQLQLIASVKIPTTEDIMSGIKNAIHAVLQEANIDRNAIDYAMLGTTQCTNAIVERKKLGKVGVLRLGYPATMSIEPMLTWPEDLLEKIGDNKAIVHGGYEYNGALITEVDPDEIQQVLRKYEGKVDAIAVIGVFSSIQNAQELAVEQIIQETLGDIPVSLSSNIGSVGILERENATILNAALDKVIAAVAVGFQEALEQEEITNAKLYLCQNDGTLMSLDFAREYPILTIACGPTNSIRGAAYLAEETDALVLDVGGTTSDIGVLVDGFPRESSIAVEIGGVRTNFRMPDIISIGIGGGSIVRTDAEGNTTVGPDSVGFALTKHAIVFGGDTLTATDIAVKMGLCDIGDASLLKDVRIEEAQAGIDYIRTSIAEAIDKMKTVVGDVEVILVGGGSVVIPRDIPGTKKVINPENNAVANAIGASIAQASGEVEKIYLYEETAREQALAEAEAGARDVAIAAGADVATIQVVEVEEIPLAYYPGNAVKVRLKVVGNLLSA